MCRVSWLVSGLGVEVCTGSTPLVCIPCQYRCPKGVWFKVIEIGLFLPAWYLFTLTVYLFGILPAISSSLLSSASTVGAIAW